MCTFAVVFFISVHVQLAVGYVLVTSQRRMVSPSRSRDPNKLTAEQATVIEVVAVELELLTLWLLAIQSKI